MQPQCSVPDKAKAIYNGLKSVFPALPEEKYIGITIKICYFHNKQALETNKVRFSSDARRTAFESDVIKASLHHFLSCFSERNCFI